MPSGPLLNRRFTQSEVDSLLRGGFIDADTASTLPVEPANDNALQTLDRDGSPASVPNAAPGNLLGSPGADLTNDPDALRSLTPPMDSGAAPAPPPGPAPIDIGDIDTPVKGPYQPNPGAPGYQPDPGAVGKPVDAPPQNAPVGALPGTPVGDTFAQKAGEAVTKAFTTSEPLVKNPFKDTEPPPGPIPANKDSGPATPTAPPGTPEARMSNGAAQSFAAQSAQANKALSDWKKGINAAFDGYQRQPVQDQIALAGKIGDLNEKAANALYDANKNAQKQLEDARKADEEKNASDQADYDWKLNQYDKLNNEVLNEKADPMKFWANKSTGQKIGIVIGTILAGLGGDGNVLNRMVQQDLAVQESNINKKGKDLERIKGTLQDHFRNLGNKKAAREAARMNLIDSLKNQVELTAQSYGGEQARARADTIISDLTKQRDDAEFKFWQYMNPDPRMQARGAGQKLPAYDGASTVRLSDGLTFMAADKSAADEIRQTVEANSEVKSAVARMKELVKNNPIAVRLPGTAENNEYNSQVQRMRLNTDSKFLGVAKSEEGRQILNEATAVPSQWSPELEKKLDKIVERADHAMTSKVRAQNGTVVQEGFITDPATGLPKRVAIPTGQTTANYGMQPAAQAGVVKPGAAPTK